MHRSRDVKTQKKEGKLIAVNEAGVLLILKAVRKVFGGFIIEDTSHCWTPGAGMGGIVRSGLFEHSKNDAYRRWGYDYNKCKNLQTNTGNDMVWLSTWSRNKALVASLGITR